MNKLFEGCATALITPLKNGDIDYEKLDNLIEFQISNGIKALVVNGTTGEAATLSSYEKNMLLSYVIEKVNGRCKVIAGTGSNDTEKAIEFSEDAEDIGADALLIVTPYYNKCSQEGLYEHYKAIADSVNIPIILYNVPSRTSVNIEIDTVLRLSEISNIIGIKEASKDLNHILELFNKVDLNKFQVFSGNDDLIYLFGMLGGSGVISVLSNLLPFEVNTICECIENKNYARALILQNKYLPFIKELFKSVNPIGIKEIMSYKELCSNELRLPLTNICEEDKNMLINELKKIT